MAEVYKDLPMKYILFFFFCLFLAIDCFANNSLIDYFEKNKEQLLKNKITSYKNHYFIVGKAKKIASEEMAFERAQNDGLNQLISLRYKDLTQSSEFLKFGPKLQQAIIHNWQLLVSFKFTIKHQKELDKFIKNNTAYYISVVNKKDVIFTDKLPITFKRIIQDFQNNPQKRNELLFFEINPQQDSIALKDIKEENIAKRYGKKFALMFSGKEVPPISHKIYTAIKEKTDKFTTQEKFRTLIFAANVLPYDTNICTLLATKFEQMDMHRCASIMRTRAKESSKLKVTQPVIKKVTTDNKQPQNPAIPKETEKKKVVNNSIKQNLTQTKNSQKQPKQLATPPQSLENKATKANKPIIKTKDTTDKIQQVSTKKILDKNKILKNNKKSQCKPISSPESKLKKKNTSKEKSNSLKEEESDSHQTTNKNYINLL